MISVSAPTTFADIEETARKAASRAMAKGLLAAARAAIAAADAAMAEARTVPEIADAVAGAACSKGCGWCCRQVVGITTAEEELVVDALRKLSPEARLGIRRRQASAEARLNALPAAQWQAARVPCPLLDEDGTCVIHDNRPLPCRAVLSADAAICRQWHDGAENARIPLVAAQRRVYSSAQAGLAQALAAAGIPPGPVSLIEALALG